jgi:putative SOS response-associated peptidase YedK
MTWEEMVALYEIHNTDFRPNLKPRYNIAPTQMVPIVRDDGGKRHLSIMRWGWEREWAKQTIINATAEKVPTSRVFKKAFNERRCLVPADGFYEWKTEDGVKQPYRIVVNDGDPFAMAGIWEVWTADKDGRDFAAGDELESCTIITTKPNDAVKQLHNRMPLILAPDRWDAWLDCSAGEEVLQPYDGKTRFFRVSRDVNNVRNDTPALIKAV